MSQSTQTLPRLKKVEAELSSDHSIEAHASLVERPLRTLKFADAFAVMSNYGDINARSGAPEGLFFKDMRHLSHFELFIAGQRPLMLGSVIHDDNGALTVDLTNPDIKEHDGVDTTMPRDVIAIARTKFLWRSTSYERIGLRNFDSVRRQFRISVKFDADFSDLFEVRGATRRTRGAIRRDVDQEGASFLYTGLDGVARETELRFHPRPAVIDASSASFDVTLDTGARTTILVTVECRALQQPSATKKAPLPLNFLTAYRDSRKELKAAAMNAAKVTTSNALFNEVFGRARSDVYSLTTRTELGLYPYAGIPWYSTMFGRDGIITAMMLLWADPTIARGVLRHLAALQATSFDDAADAQPGKILHERRNGEMAMLGEVPFRQYYGTVDATPLFVLLAGQYFSRTGDRSTLEDLWPNIEAALRWCDTHGDRDGDGFVEYSRLTPEGLANQGWKDSYDAISHSNGELANGPIALVEVQAYVYAAKLAVAEAADVLGLSQRANALRREAESLRVAFESAFWCDRLGTYALALDGSKRQCEVRSSNAGHALFAGIADPVRARRVAEQLMGESGFSGWGVRTLAKGEKRYNPMSYHNGSVWPHDNALVAMGFGRYGLKHEAVRIFEGMFNVATYQDQRRLPELFCGFLRRSGRGPTAYPVACAPQAWAAAAPFALLSGCLGLELPALSNEVRFVNPLLPAFLEDVRLDGVRVAESTFDLNIRRHGHDVTINVLKRHLRSDARVVLVKSA